MCVGHSLGGGVASLLACLLRSDPQVIEDFQGVTAVCFFLLSQRIHLGRGAGTVEYRIAFFGCTVPFSCDWIGFAASEQCRARLLESTSSAASPTPHPSNK